MIAAPRRVLFPFTGDSIGGSHLSALALVDGLDRSRFEPVVGLHQPEGPLGDHLAARGMAALALPPVPMPRPARLLRNLPRLSRALPPLSRLLREQRIGIVHTNDRRMHFLWGWPARKTGTAQLWHQRTPARGRRLDGYARFPAAVVTISDLCRDALPPRMGRLARVVADPVAAPDPAALAGARDRLRAAMGVEIRGPIIGFVANFAPRKEPLFFVRLAAALADRPDAPAFAMLGEPRPPLGGEVERAIAAAGLTGRCTMLGPRFPVEPWMAGFDLLVAPARDEGFGRTLVEAMLCGVPVLASDAGGHREIVRHGETGWLAPPGDVAAFSEGAARLLDAPESVVFAARTDATARYSLAAHADAMEAIYDAI